MELKVFWVLIQSVYVTLKISVITLFEVYTGMYHRAKADIRLRWWSSKLLEFARISYTAVNPHQFNFQENRPYIVMSNHSSHYDIPLIFMSLPGSIRMLTKKELFAIPIWGRGLKAGEFISIDRKNREQALKDLDRARLKMESGIILWIAPEGTRSYTGQLQPFKKGGFMLALEMGATILPIGIRDAHRILPAKTWDLEFDCHVEVHVGTPIEASQYTAETRDHLMDAVTRQILTLANVSQIPDDSSLSTPEKVEA